MDKPENDSQSPEVQRLCPQCGASLESKGKIVDAGGYKKWVEEWHCPTHGVVKPAEEKRK